MDWTPTEHDCPDCGEPLHLDPLDDIPVCLDCERGFPEEALE